MSVFSCHNSFLSLFSGMCGLVRKVAGPLAVLGLVGLWAFAVCAAPEIPQPKGFVSDYARMLSGGTVSRLETMLEDFERSDSTQVVVLTVDSLQGWSPEEYALKVVENWKPGQKGKDNGVLLLVAKKIGPFASKWDVVWKEG